MGGGEGRKVGEKEERKKNKKKTGSVAYERDLKYSWPVNDRMLK